MENVYYFLNTKTLVGYVDEDVYKYFPGQIINESNYKDIIINNETVYIDLEEVPSRFLTYNETIKNVYFSNKLQLIDNLAFAFCENLEFIHFPDIIDYIDFAVFSHCNKLKSVNIHKINVIGDCSFSHCNSLKSVRVYYYNKMEFGSFSQCPNLKTFIICGFSPVNINNEAFIHSPNVNIIM